MKPTICLIVKELYRVGEDGKADTPFSREVVRETLLTDGSIVSVPKKITQSTFHTCVKCGAPLELKYSKTLDKDNQQTLITAVCSEGCEGTYTVESSLVQYPTPQRELNNIVIHGGNCEGIVHVADNKKQAIVMMGGRRSGKTSTMKLFKKERELDLLKKQREMEGDSHE